MGKTFLKNYYFETTIYKAERIRLFIIRLGLNVALTDQIRSYYETKGTMHTWWTKKGRGKGNDMKSTATTKNKPIKLKKEKQQLILVWSLAYNLSDLSGPTRNMHVPDVVAYKIIETHNSPYNCGEIKYLSLISQFRKYLNFVALF